jgi:hypothetical protein
MRGIHMKRGLPVLLVLLLAISALLPMTCAAAMTEDSQTNMTGNSSKWSSTVTEDTAISIALLKINEIGESIPGFVDWQDAYVEYSTTYYDLDGIPAAYSFDVIKKEQYIGYIRVSATRKNYPVLEFSKGFTPDKDSDLMTQSKDLANSFAKTCKMNVGKAKVLYLGATFYYAEFPLTDSESRKQNRVIIDLTTPSVIDENPLKILIDQSELTRQQQEKEQEIKVLWNVLDTQMNVSDQGTAIESVTGTSGYISGVPTYLWQLGCSPTASAMVLGYWDGHGYPNFPQENSLIQELATAMRTTPEGSTWPWDIDDGIDEVCTNHGYSSMDVSDDAWMTFDEVKSEVDAQRPFVISMWSGGTPIGGESAYGDHSVACVGYHDYTEDWVSIHDTWDTQIHNIVYGNWLGAMATWVRP